MIAFGVRYLAGYACATSLPLESAEWPVHPARVFMALAAAHFESGASPAEREALEWMEELDAPAMKAGLGVERAMVKTYVPVNDHHGGIAGRSRQEKAQRKVWLEDDTVFLIWQETPDASLRGALEELCSKVTRIGHSSSLVQMWVVGPGDEPKPNMIPAKKGQGMRVPGAGAMAELDTAFNAEGFRRFEQLSSEFERARGREKAALKTQLAEEFPSGKPEYRRPDLATWQNYAAPAEIDDAEPDEGPFDSNLIVLSKFSGKNLGLEGTLQLTGALRNAAMKASEYAGGPPEWLSGHERDGSPSKAPHAAFLPLAFVGDAYADGHLLGAAIALPRGIDEEELRRVLGPLFFDPETGAERRGEGTGIGVYNHYWRWELERETRERPPVALRAATWVGPSRNWASVTPVVLNHYPKKNREGDVERILREVFQTALLPEIDAIRIQSASAIEGAGHARSMPEFEDGGPGLCRYQTHVQVRFRRPVAGPVLVGRGRYRGYGLFRPTDGMEGKNA